MKEFLPWSKTVNEQSINEYKKGHFPILDVQLSGVCNYNCVYCDSPNRNTPSKININYLKELISYGEHPYKWLFICGLGEPLFAKNKEVLLDLLDFCKSNNIKCTIFTNGSNIDESVISFIKEDILYPIIKIDTFSKGLANELYETREAEKNLDAIKLLFEISKNKHNNPFSHIAASIVPTSKNICEIQELVRICIEYDVFPLLGQLEYAGKAINQYNDLLLSKNDLINLKHQISSIIQEEYSVPICPSVISGIHINNNGFVSVDQKSGLSCSWFWLETPKTIDLCSVNEILSLTYAEKHIIDYRAKVLSSLPTLEKEVDEHPFGGCGGNIKDLFNQYIRIQEQLLIS